MQLNTLLRSIEKTLPPETAMKGDRIGLQLQSGRNEITSVYAAMEITDEVIDEAIEVQAECIVAFHPLIFSPLTSIVEDERVGRLCSRLIRHSIALIVAHTNFDAFPQGTSSILAERLQLNVEGIMVPDAVREGFGMGVVATPHAPLQPAELLERIHGVCRSPLRFTDGKSTQIDRIGIVGGSGSSFISEAISAKVDAFITADVKYHDFHRVKGALMLVDPGHYEMEQFVPHGLSGLLRHIASETPDSQLRVHTSTVVPNPVRYYPDTVKYVQYQEQLLDVSTFS